MRALLRLQTFAADVPMQLSQILLDLETGKLMVNVAGAPIERLARDVRGLGLAIFTGLIACGLTIGALLSFSRLDRTVHGIPLLGALAAIAVGILSGAVITWSLASGKHWKFSIARWLERRQTRSR
jgi:ubiquinone biosynthesis protein